jgi:dUTP pyrophosphatase
MYTRRPRPTPGACLSRQTIAALIASKPPLIEGFLALDAQLQPNGFDMTLDNIARFTSPGSLGPTNTDRVLSATEPVAFNPDGYAMLAPGPYLVRLNETVNLPLDIMALAKPRSSLLRSGVAMHNAVWDAGYSGRSQAMLMVYNPLGFRVARNARILQLVFFRLDRPVELGYQGAYQGEGRPNRA